MLEHLPITGKALGCSLATGAGEQNLKLYDTLPPYILSFEKNHIEGFIEKEFLRLKRWLNGSEHTLVFQRTQVQFPELTSQVSSQLSGTLSPDESKTLVSLGTVLTCTQPHSHTHIYVI